MTWQDFWSTILPAYLGALGSIAASTVAVAAFVRDLRTRRGLKEVAEASATTVEILLGGAAIAGLQVRWADSRGVIRLSRFFV